MLIIASFFACSTDEFCAEPTESLANLKFYSRLGRLLNDTTVLGFSAAGIFNPDSLLYDSVNTGSFDLPLSPSASSSVFVFSFSIPDTLYLTDTIHTESQVLPTEWRDRMQLAPSEAMLPADSVIIDTIPYFYYKYDTVSFYYSKELYFISQSCGFTYHYLIDSVASTKNVIDTIVTNTGTITTSGNEDFKILL